SATADGLVPPARLPGPAGHGSRHHEGHAGLSAHQGQAAVGVGGTGGDRRRDPPADCLGRGSRHAVDGPVPCWPCRRGRQGWSSVARHTWHRGTPKMDKFVVSLGNVYGREPLSVVYHGKLDSLWIHCLVEEPRGGVRQTSTRYEGSPPIRSRSF